MSTLAKAFLLTTGVSYAGLAIYCSLMPLKASNTVHLTLKGAGGRSEFLTVYGGLEFGMALIFLLPLVFPEYLKAGLWGCFLIHASLVLFRSLSFVIDSSAIAETRSLAIGEWVIFLVAAALVAMTKR